MTAELNQKFQLKFYFTLSSAGLKCLPVTMQVKFMLA